MVIEHLLFQTIHNRKPVGHMFAYLDSVIGFIQKHFYYYDYTDDDDDDDDDDNNNTV